MSFDWRRALLPETVSYHQLCASACYVEKVGGLVHCLYEKTRTLWRQRNLREAHIHAQGHTHTRAHACMHTRTGALHRLVRTHSSRVPHSRPAFWDFSSVVIVQVHILPLFIMIFNFGEENGKVLKLRSLSRTCSARLASLREVLRKHRGALSLQQWNGQARTKRHHPPEI